MPPAPGRVRSRWGIYAGLSTALAGGVILKSLAQRPNFFSAAVYLSQSSANLMVLANLIFVSACSLLLLLQRSLYGPLRPIEVEQLYEKAWFAITETCLAMTIFRGEIGAWFLIMFFSLLASKVWGWIGEGRVEVLEQQPPRNPGLFHTRLALSLGLSMLFNVSMLEYIVGQILHMARPDMMVMFGFEFAVLAIMSITTAMRYALNLVEIGIVRGQKLKRVEAIRKERIDAAVRNARADQGPDQGSGDTSATEQVNASSEQTDAAAQAAAAEAAIQPIDETAIEVEGWDNKGRYVFYLDLITDFLKLSVYITFFFILLIFYGLPLHIMRDVFLTFRSFIKRIGDFMRYRTATRDMNDRYPDATAEEVAREDVCIICRENMTVYVPPAQGQPPDAVVERMRPKKLPCGHVLHFSCLRSWLERQQVCPTCRATVVPTTERSGQAAAGAQARGPGNNNNNNNNNNGNNHDRPAGPRIYQFGPLRIGVGAARGGNMMEDLQNQLGNAGAANANHQNNQHNQNNRQYGIGIRWDGLRGRRNMQARPHRGSVQDQLSAAERQIARELDQLQASMGEIQQLRSIQTQLNALRMARQGPQQGPQIRPVIPPVVNLAQQDPSNVIPAGSDQLPPGLILPEGWTMMPLHQMPGPSTHPVPVPVLGPIHMGPRMPVPPTVGMFSGMPPMPTVPPMHGMPVPGNVQTAVLHGPIPLRDGQIPPQYVRSAQPAQQIHQGQHLSSPLQLQQQQQHQGQVQTPMMSSSAPSLSSTRITGSETQRISLTQDLPRASPLSQPVGPSTNPAPPQPGSVSVRDDVSRSERRESESTAAPTSTVETNWGFPVTTSRDSNDTEDEDDDSDQDEERGKPTSSRSNHITTNGDRPSHLSRQPHQLSKGKQPRVDEESDEENSD